VRVSNGSRDCREVHDAVVVEFTWDPTSRRVYGAMPIRTWECNYRLPGIIAASLAWSYCRAEPSSVTLAGED